MRDVTGHWLPPHLRPFAAHTSHATNVCSAGDASHELAGNDLGRNAAYVESLNWYADP